MRYSARLKIVSVTQNVEQQLFVDFYSGILDTMRRVVLGFDNDILSARGKVAEGTTRPSRECLLANRQS